MSTGWIVTRPKSKNLYVWRFNYVGFFSWFRWLSVRLSVPLNTFVSGSGWLSWFSIFCCWRLLPFIYTLPLLCSKRVGQGCSLEKKKKKKKKKKTEKESIRSPEVKFIMHEILFRFIWKTKGASVFCRIGFLRDRNGRCFIGKDWRGK